MNIKKELLDNNYSLVASNGYHSSERGIKPVISKMNEDLYYFRDLIVSDKLIGKASAMLLCLSGVKEVYTVTLSKAGQEIFEKYGIPYHYDELVEYIINRKGDGMCPMEMTVKHLDDLHEAYEALNRKLALLS